MNKRNIEELDDIFTRDLFRCHDNSLKYSLQVLPSLGSYAQEMKILISKITKPQGRP